MLQFVAAVTSQRGLNIFFLPELQLQLQDEFEITLESSNLQIAINYSKDNKPSLEIFFPMYKKQTKESKFVRILLPFKSKEE